MIIEGRVKVNAKTVTELGSKADPEKDKIEVDGKVLGTKASSVPPIYIVLNKPKKFISSLSDPEGRPVVTDLLIGLGQKVYPVGRLDYDAEGVLLLTNDGDLANRLMHPRFSVPKIYLVKVRDVPDEAALEKLEKGVRLEDGWTLPAKVKLIKRTKENSWIELTVTEGRNRLVKRMCMAVGHPVVKLKRVEFSSITIGKLKPGQFRALTTKEIDRIQELSKSGKRKGRSRRRGSRPPK